MTETTSGPTYRVRTAPDASDARMRGRRYAIPFDRVWVASFHLLSGGMPHWSLTWEDDASGVLEAKVPPRTLRPAGLVRVRVFLDADAQTCVEMAAGPVPGGRDLGASRRRVRAFFEALDRELSPKPGERLTPRPAVMGLLMAVTLAASGCADEPADRPATSPAAPPPDAVQVDSGRVYERALTFLGTGTDSVFGAPWLLSVRTGGETIQRSGRGWFLRGDVWDPFYTDVWETPSMRAPWRPLPHGPLRMVVGEGDALEQLSFVDGGRRLDLILDSSRAEWTGRRGETFRFLDAGLVLAERRIPGVVLDLNRTYQLSEGAGGDWAMLVSGDSLHAVLHAPLLGPSREPAAWRGWVHLDFRDIPLASLTAEWSAVRAFDRARRDVPVGWTIRSADGTVRAELEARSSILTAGEGEGPLLPVDGWFEVTGTFDMNGDIYPVHGLLRHTQHD